MGRYAVKEDRVFDLVLYSIIIIFTGLIMYPLIYVISASISDPIMVNSGKIWLLPKGVTFDGYRRVFQDEYIWIGYRNSVVYTLVGTTLNLIMTLSCAYPLSRKDFYGRKLFTLVFTFTMFFSGGLIPTYLIVKQLGMIDTIWALIIPNAVSMWNIIITRTFFQSSIPYELQEAATIDGCSDIKIFLWIMVPLSLPIIAVMALFYGVGHWNAFFSALIYISRRQLYPLQLILREILIQNQMSAMMTTGEMAESIAQQAKLAELIKYSVIIVSSLPVLIIYPFIQRYFVKGVMIGAIKG